MISRIAISCVAMTAFTACTTPADDHASAVHGEHSHVHGENCGHAKVWHVDHWDYLHDGHLHFVHEDHVDEHTLDVTDENPDGEAQMEAALHADHFHGEEDAHMMIPHGDHMDYLHDGHLHHVHDDHIDDHGPVTVEQNS